MTVDDEVKFHIREIEEEFGKLLEKKLEDWHKIQIKEDRKPSLRQLENEVMTFYKKGINKGANEILKRMDLL